MVSPRFNIAPKLLALVKANFCAIAEVAKRLKAINEVRIFTISAQIQAIVVMCSDWTYHSD